MYLIFGKYRWSKDNEIYFDVRTSGKPNIINEPKMELSKIRNTVVSEHQIKYWSTQVIKHKLKWIEEKILRSQKILNTNETLV